MNEPRFPKPPYSESQRLEAADWFVTIRGPDEPDSETLQSWLQWMNQDKGNCAAFEAIAQVWHCIPRLAELEMPQEADLSADLYDGTQTVQEWLLSRRAEEASTKRIAKRYREFASRQSRRGALLAASLTVFTVGLIIMLHLFGRSDVRSSVFTTKTGEQLEIALDDGSHVWLGPKSNLRVDFSRQRRGIELATGEAFFSVAKDKARPFIVRSPGGEITAVGTAFNVRAVTKHVTVSVTEGVVSVAPGNLLPLSSPQPVRVASGQQLTFAAEESVKSLAIASSASPGERARWREGVLVYRDEPLSEVVADVARYSSKQLEITGDAIENLHYTGIVYKGAIDEWTSALPESFPVKVVVDGNRETISPR